ncbi:hypothetical protein DES53_103230 [Roseimicrobium gellanilyticum]|uniref:Uncharacterized protein n=1 Tax=Roseimicrobium gellanilyticum TaxID=748857 RepID=A0A366HRQ1_9BACT|nr:hypothetical protein [Roseimicrobium gellanilyticum]RBP45232.1 hypothetical protein DES53_103230 [Roseimicrobium gellanilyticum]
MMKRHAFLAACFAILSCSVSAATAAEGSAVNAPPKGLRVATAGHSFHVWMPALLKEMAAGAGITGHEIATVQGIGGSRVIQHWDLAGDKNKVKPVLEAGKADVLTLSPIYLPDPGIENFVTFGLQHNPALRVTIQEFWVPFDDPALWATRGKGVTIDRDTKTMEQLRAAHATYFEDMDKLVRELNTKAGKSAVFVVPVGQAVLALREKVIKGEAPGISKQSELFTDPLGHCRAHIMVLAAYCHFAVIYQRSPIGLPVPASLAKLPEAEKLNRLLQELAWQAATQHPLSGVKSAPGETPSRS